MTNLAELIEQAATGDLDHGQVAALAADVMARVMDQVSQSNDPATAEARAYLIRAQVAEAQDRVTALLHDADLIEWEAALAQAVSVAQAQVTAAGPVS